MGNVVRFQPVQTRTIARPVLVVMVVKMQQVVLLECSVTRQRRNVKFVRVELVEITVLVVEAVVTKKVVFQVFLTVAMLYAIVGHINTMRELYLIVVTAAKIHPHVTLDGCVV